MSFANNYYGASQYTLSLYFPVYSVTKINTELGMVMMNFENSFLEHLNNRSYYTFSSLYLTDINGEILSNKDHDEIGKRVEFADKLTGDSGSFWYKTWFVNYQRIGDWNFFLTNEVPALHLYQNSFEIILLLLAVMLIFLFLSLLTANRMVKVLYQPLDKVISKMNDVSSGNLRTRINIAKMDSDSRKLAEGFNVMMDEIDVLMKQVAEEERQVSQLRFDGLQSQIQPHFLYNTLDCIHWQALADGDTDTSKLIKALARYYRICLSEGQDVIPLESELEHISNYLIIQNLRYDNIIELEIQVGKEEKRVLIPKITLQPLIENAIYHGIRIKEGRRGRIRIYTEKENQKLLLVVDDDGQGMSLEQVNYINSHITDFDQSIGYGINNVNKRIELLYGKEYGIRYSLNETGGVRVKIILGTEDSSRRNDV